MFFDNFLNLCVKKKVSRADVARAIGVSTAAISKWGTGSQPSRLTLAKLADYFDVSVDYLLYGEEPMTATGDPPEDADTQELLEYYRTRPEIRMLFSITKNASPESIRRAAAVVEALEKEERGED